jgi:uncharacterized protein with HEPN domain
MQEQIHDIDRLLDIQEFCAFVLKHRPESEDAFLNDEVLRWAMLKALENIGEAANKITRATRAEFTQLEWRKMIDARHVYAHDYFKISWSQIWSSLHSIDFEGMIQHAEDIIIVLKNRFSLA